MSTNKQLPTPEQICAWLSEHGWTPEDPIPADPADGIDFTYKDRSDDGEEIRVCVSRTPGEPPWYPLLVRAVLTTAAAMEDRPEADVLAEMHAIGTGAPRTPPASVA